jgi:hypothetical protein
MKKEITNGQTNCTKTKLGFVLLIGAAAGPPRLQRPRAMRARRILAKTDGRASLLVVPSSFVNVCVLLRKTRRRRLLEDGIKVPPPSPRSGGAYNIVGGRVEVCLRRFYPRRICSDLVVVRLCSCVFELDHFDLRYSSSTAVAVLVHWFYRVLARRLPDCLLQQVMPGSGEGGAMTAASRTSLARLCVCSRC